MTAFKHPAEQQVILLDRILEALQDLVETQRELARLSREQGGNFGIEFPWEVT